MKESRKTSIVTGIAILLMAVVAGYAYGFVQSTLIVQGSPEDTWKNISESGLLFRSGVLAWIVILLLDILVAWGLYVYFKQENPNRSMLMAWLRLIYTAILAVAIQSLVKLFNISEISVEESANYVATFSNMYSVGLIVFGFHLVELGRLTLKSVHVPRVFGILILVAAAGYLFVHTAHILIGEESNVLGIIETVLGIPMAVGELAFAMWLLIKGGK